MKHQQNLEKALTGRNIRDLLTRVIVYLGGGFVLIVLALMFVYLGYEVYPLFTSASSESVSQAELPHDKSAIVHMQLEEQNQITTLISKYGDMFFFSNDDGKVVRSESPAEKYKVSAIARTTGDSPIYAMGLESGSFILVKPVFSTKYIDADTKEVIPAIEYPLGADPRTVKPAPLSVADGVEGDAVIEIDRRVKKIAVNRTEEKITVISHIGNEIVISRLEREEGFLDDSTEWSGSDVTLSLEAKPDYIIVDQQQLNLILIEKSGLFFRYNIGTDVPHEVERGSLLGEGGAQEKITAAVMLAGSNSIVVGTDKGSISQWFLTRKGTNANPNLTKTREFGAINSGVAAIFPENSRRGMAVVANNGKVSFIYATSNRVVLQKNYFTKGADGILAISPRVNAITTLENGKISFYHIDNEHPEISYSALWQKVWYEGYDAPEYIWQSSSASNDFEAKFSFAPLVFGTIKAAFYAMLFAVPIAVLAGAYTAYFMTPGLRKVVKPTVEIMAALPTVILGFLAGLLLAPFIENNLLGIFLLPLMMILFTVLVSLWKIVPNNKLNIIPEGAEIVILIPILMVTIALTFYLSHHLDVWLFEGPLRNLFISNAGLEHETLTGEMLNIHSMRDWVSHAYGLNIDFNMRNSIIIGIAMGIAVIPNIFSITEDAIFSVPKSLTSGSLALGATPWQTMVKVVILTASPGIFSAIMIGLGRAIGETMIVLMAAGNTPIMDFNIFEGMRTLAANIAVEMPEAERGSTHFRLLFLSGFTLFILTFIFNTLSEVISHRLRKKYSSM